MLAPMSAMMERGEPSHWSRDSAIALALLSIVGSAGALPLFYWLLKQVQPSELASVEWMQPLVAVVEGAVLLRQPIPTEFIVGSAVAVACAGALVSAARQSGSSASLGASDS